jgi:hypothetical protein
LKTKPAPSRAARQRDEVAAAALRELIAAVIVQSAGKDEPRIEVRGRLAQLTARPNCFPNRTFWQRW